jgi:glutamine synthetase
MCSCSSNSPNNSNNLNNNNNNKSVMFAFVDANGSIHHVTMRSATNVSTALY